MNINAVRRKLKKMSTSIKNKNIVESFPVILDDIKYLIGTFDIEVTEELSEEDRINYTYEMETARLDYLCELIRQYMKLKWDEEFKYEIVDGYLFDATGGYNQKEDKVVISVFGMIQNSENIADYIRSISHEFRHQLQYHFLHEKNIESILKYPSYFITIAKNLIPKEIKATLDEEGHIIDKPFYNDNYEKIYMEVDANKYGVEVINNLLLDLYSMYPHKDDSLASKLNSIQTILSKQSTETNQRLESEGRIDSRIVKEIYTPAPITSTIMVDGEEKDSLLYIDKCLKEEPIIKEKYEVFGILMNDYGFKTYMGVLLDKYKDIEKYKQKEKITRIYNNIIKTDPMLTVTKLITEKDIAGLKRFIKNHPTFIKEYQEDIGYLSNTLITDSRILNLLSEDEEIFVKRR